MISWCTGARMKFWGYWVTFSTQCVPRRGRCQWTRNEWLLCGGCRTHTHTFHCPLGLKDAGIFCLCTGPKINSTGSSHQNKTTLGSSGKRQGTNSVYWEKRKLCNRLPGMLDILEAFTIWQLVYIRFWDYYMQKWAQNKGFKFQWSVQCFWKINSGALGSELLWQALANIAGRN